MSPDQYNPGVFVSKTKRITKNYATNAATATVVATANPARIALTFSWVAASQAYWPASLGNTFMGAISGGGSGYPPVLTFRLCDHGDLVQEQWLAQNQAGVGSVTVTELIWTGG